MKTYVPIKEIAKKLGVSRGKIYAMIVYGKLKKGVDYKEITKQSRILVVREDLQI